MKDESSRVSEKRARKERTRRWLLASLALSAVPFAAWLCGAGTKPQAKPSPTPASSSSHAQAAITKWQPARSRAAEVERLHTTGAPLIEEVLVDRTELCGQEPALVSVRLRTDARPPVRVSINGYPGNPVPVTFGAPGDRIVAVRAATPDGLEDTRLLRLSVRDCAGQFQYVKLDFASKRDTGVADVYRFAARPFLARAACAPDAGGPGDGGAEQWLRCNSELAPGETREYHWDFGDGTRAVSREGYIEHDFSDRQQTETESTFLVKVELISSIHGSVAGLASLVIENNGVENKLRFGVITPLAHADCGSRNATQGLACQVTFRNPDPATITLHDVEVTAVPCDEERLPESFTWPARRVLSTTELGRGVTSASFKLGARDIPARTCSLSFRALGHAGHLKAEALFGAQLQPQSEVLGPAEAQADPEVKQRYERITQALKLLGRDPAASEVTISEDEIAALEMQGLL
jgi:hypothetical protein